MPTEGSKYRKKNHEDGSPDKRVKFKQDGPTKNEEKQVREEYDAIMEEEIKTEEERMTEGDNGRPKDTNTAYGQLT